MQLFKRQSPAIPLAHLLVCTLCLPYSAWAADNSSNLDTLLQLPLQELLKLDSSIASGETSSILKSVATVSVITHDDIERYNFASIADALQTVAGFDVYRTYYRNNIPTARGILQDHYANKVLLMINSTPTWNAVTGEGNLDRINIHDVEKIEVLKGPASVLYGTNAYSGAINIVLKKPENMNNSIYTKVGNNNHYESGGSWGYTRKDGDLALMATVNSSHGGRQQVDFVDEKGIDGNFEDYTDNRNLTFTGRYQNHSILINAYDNTEAYMGIIPDYEMGIGYGQELSGYLLSYEFEHNINSDSTLSLAARYDWNHRDFLRSIIDNSWGEAEGRHIAGQALYDLRLNDNYHLDVGIDFDDKKSNVYRNYLKSSGETLTQNNLRDRNVLEYSVFSTLDYEKGDWKWDIGLRNVDNELYDTSLSGRATLVYSLSNQSSVKLIIGQSYRSPSLFELYVIPPEKTVFSNPALLPEKSTSYELAYLKSFGNLFLQISTYKAYYTDKIFRDRDDVLLADNTVIYNTLVYKNGGDISVDGLEAEVRYQAESWSSFTNVNWQHGDDGDRQAGTDHYNFKYVPSYTISAGISKNIENVLLSSVVNFRDKTESSTSEQISSNLTLDIAATYKQILSETKYLQHKVALNNATNEQVEVADYARRQGLESVPQQVGREITYEISFNF